MPSLHIPAKSVRGLAPPSALDKLGFEPAQSADELIKNVSPGFILRMNLSIMCLKIELSRLMPAKSARSLAPPSALDKLGFEPAQSVDELIKSVSLLFTGRMY